MSGGWATAGYVQSWTWQDGVGWAPAFDAHGLPRYAGFGYRGHLPPLVDQLEAELTRLGRATLSWREAVDAVPALDRLTPEDFNKAKRLIENRGLEMLEKRGVIAQVGRP
jgi:hypothetical protein